jgi:hypothetical protein
VPYQLFRLSLLARRKPPLLEGMQGVAPAVSRQDYLAAAFGRRIDFTYRKMNYCYIKVTDIDQVVAGRIGRPGTEHTTGGPETGFAPFEHEGHLATNVFIGTAGDADGQMLAFQINPRVGTPRPILEALIQRINDIDVDVAWQTEIKPMSDEGSFWKVAEENAAIITSLQLTLIAPNILGFRDSVVDELKLARDENNAATVVVAIDNKDGIKVDTQSIRNAVHYVSEGGGDAALRNRRKVLFDSRRRTRTISVEGDTPVAQDKERVLRMITTFLFGK